MHTPDEGAVPMSLRGADEPEEPKDTVSFRCPVSLVRYVEEEAKATRRTATAVHVAALELDRAINEGLQGDQARLEAIAKDLGLSLRHDLGEIVVALVKRSIASRADGKPASRPGKKK